MMTKDNPGVWANGRGGGGGGGGGGGCWGAAHRTQRTAAWDTFRHVRNKLKRTIRVARE